MTLFKNDEIFIKKDSKRKRLSSYSKTGDNEDRVTIKPNESLSLDIKGPGIIRHIWCTIGNREPGAPKDTMCQEEFNLRKVVFKVFYDNEENASINVPLGDFFGMGFGISKPFTSEFVMMSGEEGKALNSFFAMPYRENIKIEFFNECHNDLVLYYYVDYDEVEELDENAMYLHAQYRRDKKTKGKNEEEFASHMDWMTSGENIDGKDNYVVLDAKGTGTYIGCNLNILNLHNGSFFNWIGEGDDMIFIDGDEMPTLNGTGLEDYFNLAWCPSKSFYTPTHGLTIHSDSLLPKYTFYRFHNKDLINFEKSIKVTFEHGHNNNRSDDYSSTAYWYQFEPHKPFGIDDVKDRMPTDENELYWNSNLKLIKY